VESNQHEYLLENMGGWKIHAKAVSFTSQAG
jgi:hypothetical protein